MLKLDHIAVACATLADGVAYVEETLGLKMGPGGKHVRFGTHNRLLGLGDTYLEVIAVDPDATPPNTPRWFDLDNFAGSPRITNWICNTANIAAALNVAPNDAGRAVDLQRDTLTWKIAVPEDGGLPLGGAYPTLIEWGQGVATPSETLPDSGARLQKFTVRTPDYEQAQTLLTTQLPDPRIQFAHQDILTFEAEILTPSGPKVLR